MKNPCEKCIVKCMCTKLCEDKYKYGTYLENKICNNKFFSSGIFTNISSNEYKKYKNFARLLRSHRQDEIEVNNRRISCKYHKSNQIGKEYKGMKYKYKVVKKRNNTSCIIKANSDLCLIYDKDTTVYALEKTLGIMVFKTKYAAENWIEAWERGGSWKIKRVIPIGRGKTPNVISSSTTKKILTIFYTFFERNELHNLNRSYKNEPIYGTICYPGVFVVD
ncbi:MAG: hypothetical protein ACTSWK_01905 [Promethearchaeota archaeon]